MFRKRRPTNTEASVNNSDPSRCERSQYFASGQYVDGLRLPAKRQRIAGGAKILLDIAKESSDCFPLLKSALGFVNALIKHYEVVVEPEAVVHG